MLHPDFLITGAKVQLIFKPQTLFLFFFTNTAKIPTPKEKNKYLIKKLPKIFGVLQINTTFAPVKQNGAIAQLVEQRTENPCVPGSIPGGTT